MGGEVTVRTEVTDTYMQQIIDNSTSGAVNKMELSSIKKVVQTKNLILVFTKARLVWILRKDTFGDRSKEEFLAFLRGKGLKIKS